MRKQNIPGFLSKTLAQGLAIIIPILGALYLLIWAIRDSEKAMKALLLTVLPESLYLPGLGLAVFLAITFLLGLLMYPWLTRTLLHRADGLFRRIPLFGSVYSPLKDLFDLFGGNMAEQLGEPVMIRVPNTEMETLGFITRRGGGGLPPGMIPEGHVVVYVQWSSQIGGYCFVVSEDAVRPVNMSVEEGMRWALTAGLSAPDSDREAEKAP